MINIFSERLKQLRLYKNLKQSDIAEILNISVRSYRRYEINENLPTFEKLIIIADYFNVSTDYLLGRTDNPEINK